MRKREQKGLPWLKPHGKPILFVVPHVDRSTDDIAGIDFLSGCVLIVGFDFSDHIHAVPRSEANVRRFFKHGRGEHWTHGSHQQQSNKGEAHVVAKGRELNYAMVTRLRPSRGRAEKIFETGGFGKSINRHTLGNQRKIRLPKGFKKKAKVASAEKVEAKPAETSCQTTGCGCGN